MRMAPEQKMSNLFQQIDTSGSGTISKAQFEQAFQSMNPPSGFKAMGADAIFNQLDPKGTGKVSKENFVNGMKSLMEQIRHHPKSEQSHSSLSPAQTLSNSLNALNGSNTESGSEVSGTNINLSA